MTPTTEQLKNLLAKVTPGEWRAEWYPGENSEGRVWIGDKDPIMIEGGNYCRYDATCEDGGESRFEAETHLVALAPTLAAEVVALRAVLGYITDYNGCLHSTVSDKLQHVRDIARQSLDATNEK